VSDLQSKITRNGIKQENIIPDQKEKPTESEPEITKMTDYGPGRQGSKAVILSMFHMFMSKS
jgi:hypothetical protein